MRLFLIGDTPLIDRVGLAFQDWFEGGELWQTGSVANNKQLEEMFAFNPTVVLYDAPWGSYEVDAKPAMFHANGVNPGISALFAASLGASFYYVSDPYVFPGRAAAPDWEKPYPANTFGFTRLLGEHVVRSLHPNAAIVRCGWLYGQDIPESPPAVAQEVLDDARTTAAVYEDILGNPTYVGDAAAMLTFRIMQGEINNASFTGTFHLAPTVHTDWYTYLKDDFPVTPITFRNKISQVWHRDAGLVPSEAWTIASGGLERYMSDVKKGAWNWTASLVSDFDGDT